MSSCLGRAAVPVKRVWRGLSARLGRRRRSTTTGGKLSAYVPVNPDHEDDVLVGLGRLRKDVRTCEYRDVHVMWEMLSSSNGDSGRGGGSCTEDIMAGVAVARRTCAPAATTTTRRTRGRKPAPCSRLVAYCCAF